MHDVRRDYNLTLSEWREKRDEWEWLSSDEGNTKPPAVILKQITAKTIHIRGRGRTITKQPVKQRAPELAKMQKTTEKTDFVALPTILVAAKISEPMEEENVSKLNIKTLLESHIRPKALGVKIISCREARSKNILISVPTQEMASKLLEAINEHSYLKTVCEARFPQKRDPQIIIYDIDNTGQDKNVEEEDFITRIRTDNNLPAGKIRVLFRKPGRGARSHWVLSVSPNIYKVIKNDKRLHYGFGSKKFKEHLEPIRCQNCLKFGHSKNIATHLQLAASVATIMQQKLARKTAKRVDSVAKVTKNNFQNRPLCHLSKLSLLQEEH
ncbi:hypothetical protein HNY73_017434 [Argiope bruennichi]|uniref:Uncharacterized protein n=1 Tax=Argiope bruennichi TaxID=94029 RepID=A0A8T0EAM7_ARGBR|nr:hypothetical protein HNY73_017434 [Argiope bruennichi]